MPTDITDISATYNDEFFTNFYKVIGEIPFEHSAFQIKQMILSKESPERILRQCCLEMHSKLEALNKARFNWKKNNVNIRKLQSEIDDENTNEFDRELKAIEIEELENGMRVQEKFIKDALIDLSIYHAIYDELPKPTRKKFEESEKQYWHTRIVQDAQKELLTTGTVQKGTIDTLQKLGYDPTVVMVELKMLTEKQVKERSAKILTETRGKPPIVEEASPVITKPD